MTLKRKSNNNNKIWIKKLLTNLKYKKTGPCGPVVIKCYK